MKLIDSELGGTTPLDILIKFNENEILINQGENEGIEEETINEESLDLDLELDLDIDLDENLMQENSDIWFSEYKLITIKKIHEYLESKEEIGKVQSLYSLINMANLIKRSDLSLFELSILYNQIPE